MLIFLALSTAALILSQVRAQPTSLVDGENYPHEIPEPLPDVTPDGIVNLMLQEMNGYAGEFEASVVNSDSSSATYWVACAKSVTGTDCPFDATPPYDGLTVTQGATEMLMTHSEPFWSLSESCQFSHTTATEATCTNFWSVGSSTEDPYNPTDTGTSETYTRSYSAGLPFSSWYLSEWGRPPFIPVSITAGGEKAVASTTSVSVGGSGGSRTITAAPSGTTKGTDASQTASASSSGVTSTLKSTGQKLECLSAGILSGLLVWAAGILFDTTIEYSQQHGI